MALNVNELNTKLSYYDVHIELQLCKSVEDSPANQK